MSEDHFDAYEHYNFEDNVVKNRNSGKIIKPFVAFL